MASSTRHPRGALFDFVKEFFIFRHEIEHKFLLLLLTEYEGEWNAFVAAPVIALEASGTKSRSGEIAWHGYREKVGQHLFVAMLSELCNQNGGLIAEILAAARSACESIVS